MATGFLAENALERRATRHGDVCEAVRVPGYEYGVSYHYRTMDHLASLGVPRDGIVDVDTLARACAGSGEYAAQELCTYVQHAKRLGATHVRIG